MRFKSASRLEFSKTSILYHSSSITSSGNSISRQASCNLLSSWSGSKATLAPSNSSNRSYSPSLYSVQGIGAENIFGSFSSSSRQFIQSIEEQEHSPFSLTKKVASTLNLPSFRANASQLELIHHPKDFYTTLKVSFISILYPYCIHSRGREEQERQNRRVLIRID